MGSLRDLFDDSYFDDDEISLRSWCDVELPFSAKYGHDTLRRYDLYAHLEQDLGVRSREPSKHTRVLLRQIYTRIADDWVNLRREATREQLLILVEQSLDSVFPRGIRDIVEDFGWAGDLKVRTTLATLDDDLRDAFARRITGRLHGWVRRLRQAERKVG